MRIVIPAIFEILDAVEKAQTREAKIAVLRGNQSEALQMVVQGYADKRLQWDLPEGEVPYKPADPIGLETALYKEAKKMYLFVKNSPMAQGLQPVRREHLFIQFLESIHPKDAEIICRIKDKIPPVPSIDAEMIAEAWPSLGIVPVEAKKTAATFQPKVEAKTEDAPVKVKKKPGRKTNAERAARAKASEEIKAETTQLPPSQTVPAEYTYEEDDVVLAQGLVPQLKEVS